MLSIERPNSLVRDTASQNRETPTTAAIPPEVFKGLPPNFLREVEEHSRVYDFEKGHVFFKT